ncbi:MAG: hypothetical protein GY940_40935, partial [bacterium]|nr:hypothetical protein [bacterium]
IIRTVFEALIHRHESFRTCFRELDGRPVQILRPRCRLNLETVDLTSLGDDEREKSREMLFRDESIIPFKLEIPPLLRVKLIKCRENQFDLLLTFHHIIFDGWSMEVLEREFYLLYESYKIENGRETGPDTLLGPAPIQYKDFAVWHNRLLADQTTMQAAKRFWKGQLIENGEPLPLRLPYNFSKENLTGKESSGFRAVIPGTVIDKLKAFAGASNASLFMVLLTGFNVFLSQVSGQKDIILAVPGAARQHEDLKNTIGFFVNTLILRNRVDPDESFARFLARVQENTFQVLEYQSYPLELICSELKIKYPEISVFFNMSLFRNNDREYLEDFESFHMEFVQNAKFDMVCYLTEYKNGVEINTHYYKKLFQAGKIEKLIRLYLKILENIA